MLPSMQTPPHTHFSPWVDPRPCWFCAHFGRMLHDGTAALCARPDLSRVQASPTNGCAFWEREPGSDDEPDWVPAGVVAPIRPPVSPRQAAAAVT